MQVRDVMMFEVQFVQPDDRLRDASEKLRALGLPFLPVWDGCKVVGMVTQEAVQERAAQAGLGAGVLPVRDVMQSAAAVAHPEDDVRAAAQKLAAAGAALPGLIVIDQAGHITGVALAEDLHEQQEVALEPETSQFGAAQSMVDETFDPVDHASEESFPASDPPAPPSSLDCGGR